MIGQTTAISDRPHWITLANPGPAVPDGDGGSTPTWEALSPAGVFAKVAPATAADLERVGAGTVLATATHIVTMPYHAGVTTQTQIAWTDAVGQTHTFSVTGVANPEQRNVETIAVCVEVVG